MNLAVSNIAWNSDEEMEVAEALAEQSISYVEVAPTKYWNDPTAISKNSATELVNWWNEHGFNVYSFQSLHFGRSDLQLFGTNEQREAMFNYTADILRLAGGMGVKRLVFGSPKNRQRTHVPEREAFDIAVDFFRGLAEIANENNTVLCIEPNAPQYGCDFIYTAQQGADLVRAVNASAFRLHLDTACMALAGDDIVASIKNNIDILAHFHLSAPMLEEVSASSGVDYRSALFALRDVGYDAVVTIEMRPSDTESNVKRAAKSTRYISELLV